MLPQGIKSFGFAYLGSYMTKVKILTNFSFTSLFTFISFNSSWFVACFDHVRRSLICSRQLREPMAWVSRLKVSLLCWRIYIAAGLDASRHESTWMHPFGWMLHWFHLILCKSSHLGPSTSGINHVSVLRHVTSRIKLLDPARFLYLFNPMDKIILIRDASH